MDTAISVPEDALARAQKRAAELRMTPTEFISAALSHYLAYQDSLHLTHDVDEILIRFETDTSVRLITAVAATSGSLTRPGHTAADRGAGPGDAQSPRRR